MAATQLLNYISTSLVLTNDTLLAFNVWILSLSVHPIGHGMSWATLIALYGLCEVFHSFTIYSQVLSISATLFAFSGALQLATQLLSVLDGLKRQAKETQEKAPEVEGKQEGQEPRSKVGKWWATMELGFPVYFVANGSASALYLHDAVCQGKEITGNQKWDFGLTLLVMFAVVGNQVASCRVATMVGRRRRFVAGSGNGRLRVEGVLLVLLMRSVSRWLMRKVLGSAMPLTWPPFDLLLAAAERHGWM